MPAMSSTVTIDAPAARVWDIIAHRFDRIGEWATAIPASTPVAAPQRGRICDTGIRVAPRVTETIVAFDETAMTLTYEATAGLPAFVTLARNTWTVTPLAERRARATYRAELRVRGVLGILARQVLLARVSRDGRFLLEDLQHYAEHGEPSPRKRRRS
jgi:hypothetical protein